MSYTFLLFVLLLVADVQPQRHSTLRNSCLFSYEQYCNADNATQRWQLKRLPGTQGFTLSDGSGRIRYTFGFQDRDDDDDTVTLCQDNGCNTQAVFTTCHAGCSGTEEVFKEFTLYENEDAVFTAQLCCTLNE